MEGRDGVLAAGGAEDGTRTAMPRTAPIWREVEEIALPVAKREGGSSATAALPQAAKLRPTPAPVRIVAGRNSLA